MAVMNTLTQDESDLYYKIWRPLLQYVNVKTKMYPKVNAEKDKLVSAEHCAKLAEWLWEHKELLDDYLEDHPELPERERAILFSWKKGIRDVWMVVRHLKSGSIFIGNGNRVYLVKGIISSYEEAFAMLPMPVVMRGTVIPFEDHIITDGLFGVMPMLSGPGIRRMVKETYLEAKRNGEIIKTAAEIPDPMTDED